MSRTVAFLVSVAVAVLMAAPTARADKYDLKLSRLLWGQSGGQAAQDQADKAFENLMWDMGTALSPRFLGPGASLGSLGFQIAFNYTLSNIPENSDHWIDIMSPTGLDEDPAVGTATGADSFLQTIQFSFRKGLPFSIEAGGSVTKLLQSNLWGVGLELKYAAFEGFTFAPELAFRGGVSTFLGSRDYAMLVASGDAILSKKLGIAGLFKLAPYLGYNLQYVHGASNVIPVSFLHQGGTKVDDQAVFAAANVFRHYMTLGFQVIATVVDTGFEVGFDVQSPDHQSYSFRLGVEF
ncbi:MAG: hypothetical protein FJ109_18255 [Deltaproteobacteria bacterium]|nr:hypothetical protein [Deltaproteobacteria bacterium]